MPIIDSRDWRRERRIRSGAVVCGCKQCLERRYHVAWVRASHELLVVALGLITVGLFAVWYVVSQ